MTERAKETVKCIVFYGVIACATIGMGAAIVKAIVEPIHYDCRRVP